METDSADDDYAKTRSLLLNPPSSSRDLIPFRLRQITSLLKHIIADKFGAQNYLFIGGLWLVVHAVKQPVSLENAE